jgi:hypothetical protein
MYFWKAVYSSLEDFTLQLGSREEEFGANIAIKNGDNMKIS